MKRLLSIKVSVSGYTAKLEVVIKTFIEGSNVKGFVGIKLESQGTLFTHCNECTF